MLAADIDGESGGLALLSHALRATWEAGDRDLLTIAGYRAAGGVREALARTAESVWSDLDTDQRDAARSLLLRLVTRRWRRSTGRDATITASDHRPT